MELYRRARGVLPSVFTFIRTVDHKYLIGSMNKLIQHFNIQPRNHTAARLAAVISGRTHHHLLKARLRCGGIHPPRDGRLFELR